MSITTKLPPTLGFWSTTLVLTTCVRSFTVKTPEMPKMTLPGARRSHVLQPAVGTEASELCERLSSSEASPGAGWKDSLPEFSSLESEGSSLPSRFARQMLITAAPSATSSSNELKAVLKARRKVESLPSNFLPQIWSMVFGPASSAGATASTAQPAAKSTPMCGAWGDLPEVKAARQSSSRTMMRQVCCSQLTTTAQTNQGLLSYPSQSPRFRRGLKSRIKTS
mmetsp:Transcript_43644/g.139015  ORF Transcript_43644/g.139015 Transcript_43644/m.139015 type:complete len:224 (-) Transcript_43644:1211-1882(-)